MTRNFEIIRTDYDNVKELKVVGELDALVAPKLKEELSTLLEEGEKNFIINFEGLVHINSLAMGILRGKLRKVKGLGGDIKLVGLNDHIKTIFEMVGLDEVFEIYSSSEEAVSHF